jgi:hypothetical protein
MKAQLLTEMFNILLNHYCFRYSIQIIIPVFVIRVYRDMRYMKTVMQPNKIYLLGCIFFLVNFICYIFQGSMTLNYVLIDWTRYTMGTKLKRVVSVCQNCNILLPNRWLQCIYEKSRGINNKINHNCPALNKTWSWFSLRREKQFIIKWKYYFAFFF